METKAGNTSRTCYTSRLTRNYIECTATSLTTYTEWHKTSWQNGSKSDLHWNAIYTYPRSSRQQAHKKMQGKARHKQAKTKHIQNRTEHNDPGRTRTPFRLTNIRILTTNDMWCSIHEHTSTSTNRTNKLVHKTIIQTPERQEAYEHRPRTYNKNKKGGVETAPPDKQNECNTCLAQAAIGRASF